jgi:hypothetical protein
MPVASVNATECLLTYGRTIMQDREPPAYQEYAAPMLASRAFRLMNATQRGVLYSMKLECWINRTVPAEPGALAKILGIDAEDVVAALPAVMPFFASVGDDIRCPELDKYRAHLDTRHSRQSQGGKTGAATRANAKREKSQGRKNTKNQAIADYATTMASNIACTMATAGQVLSTTKSEPTKSTPSLVEVITPSDPWLDAYDKAPDPSVEAYRKASGR